MNQTSVLIEARDEANLRWQRLIEKSSGNVTASLNIAGNYISAGEIVEAERTLCELPKTLSTDQMDRLAIHSAHLLELRGDPQGAARLLYGELENRSNSDELRHMLARIYLQVGRNELVLDTINKMTLGERNSERITLMYARALVRLKRWTESINAIGDLQHFTEKREQAVELLYKCYVADRRLDSARAIIELLKSGASKKSQLLGKLAFTTKDYAGALEHFRSAPENDEAKVWLVRTLYAINRRDEAATEAALCNKHTDGLIRARCWEAAGHLKRAEKELSTLASAGTVEAHWYALARFHYNYRNWGRAWQALTSAQRIKVQSENLTRLKQTLLDGFDAFGVSPPRTRLGQHLFRFYSSEYIVEKLCKAMQKAPVSLQALPLDGRRRIALVINSLGPGGAERQIVNLANGLVKCKNGYDVHLLCTHLDRSDQDRFYMDQVDARVKVVPWFERHRSINIDDIPALAPYAKIIKHLQPVSRREKLIQLVANLSELQPHAVHGWLDETFVLTSIAGRLLGIPVVAGRWGSMPPGIGRTVSERDACDIAYMQSAYKSISRLSCLSLSSNSRLTGDAYASLMKRSPRDVNIVYNGIDERYLRSQAEYAPTVRKELGIPEDEIIVGSVFRMTEEKRPLRWIEIAAALSKRHPKWHFVIVGDGPMRCEIERHAANLGLCNLHLPGKRSDVGAFLTLMDLMMLTSRVEGVSNAVVEAQFCGTPVVAPDVGGLSEAMRDIVSGLLLPGDASAKDFEIAVESLLSEPGRLANISNSAREFAHSRFGMATMVSKYEEILMSP